MNFENEAALQAFIHSYVGGEREVEFPDGSRIDVLTDKYAIEVKPKLTRSSLLQALGQSTIYKNNCPDRVHVIAGLTPSNTAESYANAERVREAGTQVWYVDQMDEFVGHWDSQQQETSNTTEPWWNNPFQGDTYNDHGLDIPDWLWAIGAIALLSTCFQATPSNQFSAATSTSSSQADLTPVFDKGQLGALVQDRIPSNSTVTPMPATCTPTGFFVQIQYGGKTGWVVASEFKAGNPCE
ncbi:MAG: hypothetical protein AAGA46_03380 [Cyanobacteria bacterium P01_F01_bin.13]